MVKPISRTVKHSEEPQTLAADPLPTLQTKLATSVNGLSQTEAQSRLSRCGYNEILEKVENPFLKLLSSFWGLSPWMIETAAILSALLGRWTDFSLIIMMLMAYGIVRYMEKQEDGNVVATLRLALRANVKRDGKWGVIAARELVPGDIIRLGIGTIVPADVRVMDNEPVQVAETTATGETRLVTHHQGDVIYSRSVVKQGVIDALVYATGENTYFGTEVYRGRH